MIELPVSETEIAMAAQNLRKPKRKRPSKPTKEQVRAWLYMVMGPLIDSLATEIPLLTAKNPTWIVVAERCEFVRPISEYVSRDQEPTLRQIFRYHPKLEHATEDHDGWLRELERAARSVLSALVQVPEFLALVERIEDQYPDWRGAYRKEQGPQLLAEMIINWSNVDQPPSNYTNANAWRAHRTEALHLRENPLAAPAFRALDSAIQSLLGATTELRDGLSTLRDQLADNFGLPAAAPHVPSLFEDGI